MTSNYEITHGSEKRTGVSSFNNVVEALNKKKQQTEEEIQRIEKEIEKLSETYKFNISELNLKKQPLDETLVHIQALLRLEGVNGEQGSPVSNGILKTNLSNLKLTDVVFNILKDRRKPIHYRELAAEIQVKNIFIPGKDVGATLLSRIARDPRFRRTRKRGVYALKSIKIQDKKRKRGKT